MQFNKSVLKIGKECIQRANPHKTKRKDSNSADTPFMDSVIGISRKLPPPHSTTKTYEHFIVINELRHVSRQKENYLKFTF